MSGTVTTIFVECVSCGRYKELAQGDGNTMYRISDRDAARMAFKLGWSVAGYRGAKRTRCPNCRSKRRRDTKAADEGRIGHRAGHQTLGSRR